MPEKAIGIGASAISASGNVPTTTVRAYTADEFSKLAAEVPTP